MAIERVRVKREADVVVLGLGAQIVEVSAMRLEGVLVVDDSRPHGT